MISNSTKGYLGKATKVVVVVATFFVGDVINGITSLEGMVALFRISRFKYNVGKSLECHLRGHT